MKKYVLSAVVSGLLVPSLYAMDGGAAPPVEVEIPAVETPVEVSDVEVSTLEAPLVEAQIAGQVAIDPAPVAIEDLVRVTAVDLIEDQNVLEITDGVETVSGEQVVVDDNGDPIAVCYLGGAVIESVDENGDPILVCTEQSTLGDPTDPNMVDLASQSGVAIEDGGVHPIVYHALNDSKELPADGVVNNGDEVTPIRYSMSGGIQPNFRGGLTERGADTLAASAIDGRSDAPNPQQLNDEQRGAVRHQRADQEVAKPRTGMSKLFAKFHKAPAAASHVTQASLAETDKALASQLAQVDRMRDTALRTGDQKALAKADKMEKELRAKSTKVTKISTRTK